MDMLSKFLFHVTIDGTLYAENEEQAYKQANKFKINHLGNYPGVTIKLTEVPVNRTERSPYAPYHQ